MTIVEERKLGTIVNMMYGKHNLILQNKSHIIISSNYLVDPGCLSKDRLEILKIQNGKLVGITQQIIKHFEKLKKKVPIVEL